MKKLSVTKKVGVILMAATLAFGALPSSVQASSNSKSYTLPSSLGKLTSNAWRSTSPTTSGNTYQWDYQVSAEYSGSKTVKEIKTTWYGTASLRSGASFNIGISGTGVSAGGGSNWQTVTTVSKYWSNTNGATSSSYRSNMVVSPKQDYRSNTVSIVNTAYVKVSGSSTPYSITASV